MILPFDPFHTHTHTHICIEEAGPASSFAVGEERDFPHLTRRDRYGTDAITLTCVRVVYRYFSFFFSRETFPPEGNQGR